jgi:hypothetical protein
MKLDNHTLNDGTSSNLKRMVTMGANIDKSHSSNQENNTTQPMVWNEHLKIFEINSK